MTHVDDNSHNHLNAAKDELKSAAAEVIEQAKDKADEVVANIAEKVGKAADHITHEATK